MRGRAIYGRYRQLLFALADDAAANPDWQKDLDSILWRLKADLAELAPTDAALVRNDLWEQLELFGYGATTTERRTVLFAALKLLDLWD